MSCASHPAGATVFGWSKTPAASDAARTAGTAAIVKEHEMTDTDNRKEIWFESGGARLFAVEGGDGPPVILLHGGLANHLVCWRLAGALASRFRLITPDLRASGRSIHAGPLTWEQLADDTAALVRHLGLDRVVIGGVSFGAGCAVAFALRHPVLTAGLVLLTPAFAGADAGLTEAQHAAMQAMDAVGRRALAEGIQVLYPLLEALPADIRARARAVFDSFDPASVAATTRFLASGTYPFASAAELAAISAPTLLVPGTDPQHPVEIADVYRRHLRHCTVRDVAMPAFADGSAFADAIAAFLDQLGRAGASWPRADQRA
jgi:3-oxoadipate enol-lactonase